MVGFAVLRRIERRRKGIVRPHPGGGGALPGGAKRFIGIEMNRSAANRAAAPVAPELSPPAPAIPTPGRFCVILMLWMRSKIGRRLGWGWCLSARGGCFWRSGGAPTARQPGLRPAGIWSTGNRWRNAPAGKGWEELGVNIGELRVLCFSNVLAYGRHYVDVEFLGDIGAQEPVPNGDDGSLGEYGWFPLRDPPQPLFEPMRLAIASLLSGQWYFPSG